MEFFNFWGENYDNCQKRRFFWFNLSFTPEGSPENGSYESYDVTSLKQVTTRWRVSSFPLTYGRRT